MSNSTDIGASHKMGFGLAYGESVSPYQGMVFIDLRSPEGETLDSVQIKNIVTFDAGILLARLCRNPYEPRNGINMLAVGTGALGNLLNPDAPTREQRRLNNEIQRKTFTNVTFRDAEGAAVAFPTRVIDLTTVFGVGEAVGPLNEMGLLSTVSSNPSVTNPNPNFAGQGGSPYDPTIDMSKYDTLVNYLTFPVISKPNGSVLQITWRLTF